MMATRHRGLFYRPVCSIFSPSRGMLHFGQLPRHTSSVLRLSFERLHLISGFVKDQPSSCNNVDAV
jgi:hypothetical protein